MAVNRYEQSTGRRMRSALLGAGKRAAALASAVEGKMVKRNKRAGCGGFTLIEVMVAAMILGIGLVGVSSMVYYGVLSHQKSAHYTIAGQKAMQEMERIRDGGYLGAVVDYSRFPYPNSYIVGSDTVRFQVSDLPNGQGTITIGEDNEAQVNNPSTGAPYLNMKRVQIAVTWGGGHRASGAYNLVTLVSNRP